MRVTHTFLPYSARSKAQDGSKKSRFKGKHTNTSSASLLSLPQLDVQKLSNYDRLLNSLESNLDKLAINNANNNAGNNEADSLFLTAYMTPLNSSRPNLHVSQYSNADNADHFLPGSAFKASPDHHGEAKVIFIYIYHTDTSIGILDRFLY